MTGLAMDESEHKKGLLLPAEYGSTALFHSSENCSPGARLTGGAHRRHGEPVGIDEAGCRASACLPPLGGGRCLLPLAVLDPAGVFLVCSCVFLVCSGVGPDRAAAVLDPTAAVLDRAGVFLVCSGVGPDPAAVLDPAATVLDRAAVLDPAATVLDRAGVFLVCSGVGPDRAAAVLDPAAAVLDRAVVLELLVIQ